MAKHSKSSDLFMNFANVSTVLDGTNSTTLVEGVRATGLSIRGALIWLIHLVEIYWPVADVAGLSTSNTIRIALSTRRGLATFPSVGDDGLIVKSELFVKFQTQGGVVLESPKVLKYLPPIPIAAPQLSVYSNTEADLAGFRGKDIEVRLGFTTAPLDAAVYTEIAETWGW